MIVDITPRRLEARPGVTQVIAVTITNTGDVIGGYTLRVLGADPSWIDAPEAPFSLFPDEVRVVSVGVTVPDGIPAGERQVSIQVRELTPPESNVIDGIVLVVPAAPSIRLRADPVAVQAGRRGRFAILIDNTGNTTARGTLAAVDPERATKAVFSPATVELAPGEHTVVDLTVRGRQPFMGSPLVRVLDLHLDDPDAPMRPEALPLAPQPQAGVRHRKGRKDRKARPVLAERDTPPLANATLVQRPIISRGSVSLFGLLAAMTVFAVVLTIALSRIVGQSTADRNLALEIASAQNAASSGSGSSSVAGVVRLLTSGTGVGSIAVSVYDTADTATPIATTSTGKGGAYTIAQLPAGEYKLNFRGAGFSQIWYPQAIDAADATAIALEPNMSQKNLDVALGGVPATLSGTVRGDDVTGATLTLRTTGPGGTAGSGTGAAPSAASALTRGRTVPSVLTRQAPTTVAATTTGTAATRAVPTPAGAVVKTVPIASDGSFELAGVPSPSVYSIDLAKPGYATSTQLIDVGAGEERSGLNLTLLRGDGIISGTVTSGGAALSNATLTASSGQTSVSTASLDTDSKNPGGFTLRGLPTPGSFTLTVAKPGYVTQTLAIQLAAGETQRDLAIALTSSSGSLSGTVKINGGGAAGGVAVTVTNGTDTTQTSTRSAGKVGAWDVSGLAVPGTYTVTMSRSGLAPHTVSVELDSNGAITTASQGGGVTSSGITVTMNASTATLLGTVKQNSGAQASALGEATVTVTSGTSTYTLTTASSPAGARGDYRFSGLNPGTYSVSVTSPGTRPVSTTLTLSAGSTQRYNPILPRAASISGTVYAAPCASASTTTCQTVGAGWIVDLYKASDYPQTRHQRVTTSAGGTFTFTGLDAPASYILQALPQNGAEPSGSISLVLEGSQQLNNVRLVVTP